MQLALLSPVPRGERTLDWLTTRQHLASTFPNERSEGYVSSPSSSYGYRFSSCDTDDLWKVIVPWDLFISPKLPCSSWYSRYYVHVTVPVPSGCSLRDSTGPQDPQPCSDLPSHACAHRCAVLNLLSGLPVIIWVQVKIWLVHFLKYCFKKFHVLYYLTLIHVFL